MTMEKICRFKIFLPNKYTKFKHIQIEFESQLDRSHSVWYMQLIYILIVHFRMSSFLFVNKSANFCFHCVDAVWIFISIRIQKIAIYSASILIIDDNSPTSFFLCIRMHWSDFSSSLRSSNRSQCSIRCSCCKFADNRGLPLSINSTKWSCDKKERGLGVVESINVAIGQRGVTLIV